MNVLTMLLLAILVLVSTAPERPSPQKAVATVVIEGTRATGETPATAPTDAALTVPQSTGNPEAIPHPIVDVTGDFLQDRLSTAAYQLRKRFILQ